VDGAGASWGRVAADPDAAAGPGAAAFDALGARALVMAGAGGRLRHFVGTARFPNILYPAFGDKKGEERNHAFFADETDSAPGDLSASVLMPSDTRALAALREHLAVVRAKPKKLRLEGQYQHRR